MIDGSFEPSELNMETRTCTKRLRVPRLFVKSVYIWRYILSYEMINHCSFFFGRQSPRLQHTLPVPSNTDMFVVVMNLTSGTECVLLRAATSAGANRTILKFSFLFAHTEQ